MEQNSAFIFDDREYFFYGSVAEGMDAPIDEETYQVLMSARHKPKQFLKSVKVAAVAALVCFSIQVTGATAAHALVRPDAMEWDTPQPDLRIEFVEARKFLGLTQAEAAKMVDLSTSAVEKIEQGVYAGTAQSTEKSLLTFIEWINLLKANHRDKKFIVRAIVRAPNSLLGNISSIEYAIKNGGVGVQDLIDLEHQING